MEFSKNQEAALKWYSEEALRSSQQGYDEVTSIHSNEGKLSKSEIGSKNSVEDPAGFKKDVINDILNSENAGERVALIEIDYQASLKEQIGIGQKPGRIK